jgi:GT2 family glycosyltransferase
MVHAVIAYVRPDYVRGEFMESMLALQRASKTVVDNFIYIRSGPNIAGPRNEAVARFLTEYRAPWLLMVDTDMVFTPDTLDRLVAAADPKERPIMGGLCYAETNDGEIRPTLYELAPDQSGDGSIAFAWYDVWPENAPFHVGATGTACLLVHRTVFERVASGFGKVDRVWPWFRESTNGRRRLGEDLTFCIRAGLAGIPIYVHTGVQVGHMKSTMFGKVA